MNAKQLERRLVEAGGNGSAIDVVTRKLRGAFKVSTAGRGLNAHKLTVDEVAWIVCAYAGSETAAKADETLGRLIRLRSAAGRNFVVDVQLILRGDMVLNVHKKPVEVRICRNLDLATIAYADGSEDHYGMHPAGGGFSPTIRTEGVLPVNLLEDLGRLASVATSDAAEASA